MTHVHCDCRHEILKTKELKIDLQVVPGEQPEPVVDVGGGGHPVEQPGAPPSGHGVHGEVVELSRGEDETEHQLPVLHQINQHIERTVEGRQEAGEVAHNF